MTASNQSAVPKEEEHPRGGGRWTKKNNSMYVTEFMQHNGANPANDGSVKIMSRTAAETWIVEAKKLSAIIKQLVVLARDEALAKFVVPKGVDVLSDDQLGRFYTNDTFRLRLARMAYFVSLHRGLVLHSQEVRHVIDESITDEEVRQHRLVLPYYDDEYLMDWFIFGVFEFTSFESFKIAYKRFVTSTASSVITEKVPDLVNPIYHPPSVPAPAVAVVESKPEPEPEPEPKAEEKEPEPETEPEPTIEARLEGVESAVNTWTAHIEKKLKDAKEDTENIALQAHANLVLGLVFLFMVIAAFAICTVPSYRQLDERVDGKYKLMVANLQVLQRELDHISEWAMAFKKSQIEMNQYFESSIKFLGQTFGDSTEALIRADHALELACFSCQQLQKISVSLTGHQDPFYDCRNSCSAWEDYHLVTEDEVEWRMFDQQQPEDEDDDIPIPVAPHNYESILRKLAQQRVPGY